MRAELRGREQPWEVKKVALGASKGGFCLKLSYGGYADTFY